VRLFSFLRRPRPYRPPKYLRDAYLRFDAAIGRLLENERSRTADFLTAVRTVQEERLGGPVGGPLTVEQMRERSRWARLAANHTFEAMFRLRREDPAFARVFEPILQLTAEVENLSSNVWALGADLYAEFRKASGRSEEDADRSHTV